MKKLPVGYRLNPSDEVLVNYHLKRKLQNIQEEYCVIPEFDIYKLPPWDLITKFNGKFQRRLLLPTLALMILRVLYSLGIEFLALLCLLLFQIYLI